MGLLPRIHERGNRERKLSNAAWEMLQHYIDQDYETARQPHAVSVWVAYRQACEREGITPASLKTFGKAVRERPQETQVYKRQGKRAVHQIKNATGFLSQPHPVMASVHGR